MGMPYGSSTPPVQPEEEDDPRILEVYRFSCYEVFPITKLKFPRAKDSL
jgi:hypothetical protein